MFLQFTLVLSLVAGFVMAGPALALACGNAMLVDGDDAVQQVAQAEKFLAQGNLRKAERLVSPDMYTFNDPGLRRRATLVSATLHFRQPGAQAEDYRVRYAIDDLKAALAEDKDNPLLMSRLAEGYAIADATRGKALAMLEDLTTRDLVPEAYSYRTLARLHLDAGQTDLANQALESCQAVSKRRAECSLKKTAKKSQPKVKRQARSRR